MVEGLSYQVVGSTGMWDSRRHPDADSPQVTFHVAIYGLQNINQSH